MGGHVPSKPVFISHAAANKEIADALVDLLETGVGVSSNDIFCSSLEGMGIPSGVNFVDFIRGQIESPRVVILLLSRDYYASQFCLCELGASWVMSHRVVPLTVSPLKYSDVKAVLTGVQVLKLHDPDDLNQMQADLIEALGMSGKPFAQWEKQRKKFLGSLAPLIEAQNPLPFVAAADYVEMATKYEQAAVEVERLSTELENEQALVAQVREAKTASDVDDIIANSRGLVEGFEAAIETASDALGELPSIVQDALFYHFRGDFLPWNQPHDDDGRAQIAAAIEDDFLIGQDSGLEVVTDDPAVAEAIAALERLSSLVSDLGTNDDFQRYYADNYDHRLNFGSRRFWDKHIF
jgi:hypothetical protein